jgi:hypothetical protein
MLNPAIWQDFFIIKVSSSVAVTLRSAHTVCVEVIGQAGLILLNSRNAALRLSIRAYSSIFKSI